jgi:SAM-dependent methyltransferase
VHQAIPDGASILELGCGPGRLTRVLVAYGHDVTAVDDSDEMLAHVTGARVVRGDVLDASLDVGRRFDAVLAASHLVNEPTAARRAALLAVCRRHVRDDGLVLVERHQPGWLVTTERYAGRNGPIGVVYQRIAQQGGTVTASVTYQLGDRRWVQTFDAADVDDELLATEAGAAGLRLDRFLDDALTWAVLRPAAMTSIAT